ncbi:MAG TPA: hypothetical protein VNO14_06020 [Blastocatellia bacterium]|nr:hypothetical protein [Blastocatellia bacterium]
MASIVLLHLRHGLLLGAPDTMVLREATPIHSYYESEARIANAIAEFLKLPAPVIVNV